MEPEPEQQIDLNIRGMTCDACTLHVEKALKSVDGVRSVQVSRWASGRANVTTAAGGIAAGNALSGEETQLDLTVLPDVIFTDPQVATVGLTEAEAVAQGHEVQVATLPLAYVPRALTARDTRGFIKLVADRASDRLLGAHVLAAEAGEVIQTAALAIECGRRYGFTVTDLRAQLVPYLTHGEGLKLAAQAFTKDVSQLSCCAG